MLLITNDNPAVIAQQARGTGQSASPTSGVLFDGPPSLLLQSSGTRNSAARHVVIPWSAVHERCTRFAAAVGLSKFEMTLTVFSIRTTVGLIYSRLLPDWLGATSLPQLKFHEVAPTMISHGATCLVAPFEIARKMMRLNIIPTGHKLQCIISARSPISPDQRQEVEAAFGCPIYNLYGSTETGCIALIDEYVGDDVVGTPLLPVKVEQGRLQYAGSMNAVGYVTDGVYTPFGQWIDIGDQGDVLSGKLHYRGRAT